MIVTVSTAFLTQPLHLQMYDVISCASVHPSVADALDPLDTALVPLHPLCHALSPMLCAEEVQVLVCDGFDSLGICVGAGGRDVPLRAQV